MLLCNKHGIEVIRCESLKMCVEHCHHLLLPSWAVVNPLNCWCGGLVQPSWQDPLVHQTPPVHTSVEDVRATHKCVWNITQVIIRIHLFSITVSRFLFKMAMHTTHLIFQNPHQQIYMWWASSIPFFPEVKTTMSEWVRNSIQHSSSLWTKGNATAWQELAWRAHGHFHCCFQICSPQTHSPAPRHQQVHRTRAEDSYHGLACHASTVHQR